MRPREYQILRMYKETPSRADIVGNALALFILGLLYEVGSKSMAWLQESVSTTAEPAVREAIDVLLMGQLVVKEGNWLTVTALGEKYLAQLGLISKQWLRKKEAIRVLIVDDEPVMCDLLRFMLDDRHVQSELAYDGNEAIELIKRQQFQVVLLDIKMPGLDGWQVFDFIRRFSPKTKVIIITGYADSEAAARAFALGPIGFLAKPLSPSDILASFDRAVAASKN